MGNPEERYCRDEFFALNWDYDDTNENHYGYHSVLEYINNKTKEKSEQGLVTQENILSLLRRAVSMTLNPSSINEPFKPFSQDIRNDNFTQSELSFFEEILNDIREPWLKARLADLLWLYRKPRNPFHVESAIESYISHRINSDSWNHNIKDCWERAARLCMQTRNYDQLDKIKNQLFLAFKLDNSDNKLISLWTATLMDKLNIDSDFQEDIASKLFNYGKTIMEAGDFNFARSYFQLSHKKFKQSKNEKFWLDSLVNIADCFEKEADSRVSRSNMVANSFYENAIQAYRRIPTKHRQKYNIDKKISQIRNKISETGSASLEEMGTVKTPSVNISEIVEASITHVKGKHSIEEALIFFAGLYPGPNYGELQNNVKENMQNNFIDSFIGSTHLSADGRVIGKIPPLNPNASEEDTNNKKILNWKLQQEFNLEVELIVKAYILPALQQILIEHIVTKEILMDLCHHSPLVPDGRIYLLGHAFWLGFKDDFGSAVHLLCPQVEHIVRTKLKDIGAHTSNIDRDGIENENGLSTLMELPEAIQVFGEDLCFEIKSIFTDSLGSNLRNKVAHGLLDDDSSSSISAIYAWWMILRLVIHSIIGTKNPKEEFKE